MKKDLRLDKPAGHSGVQHNQWHAPTTPRTGTRARKTQRSVPLPAKNRRIGGVSGTVLQAGQALSEDSFVDDPVGTGNRADSPNPAVPGKQDIYLPGLQPGDTTRYRPCRHRPAVGPEQQAPLALALLGTSHAPTPDRALKTRSSSRPLKTRSPGPRRGRPAPLPRRNARR